ncbi:MAG: hypothetical protein ACU85V_00900 [Gammaproteobacteria bacterium]
MTTAATRSAAARRLRRILLLLVLLPPLAAGQAESTAEAQVDVPDLTPETAAISAADKLDNKLRSLDAFYKTVQSRREAIETLRAELKAVEDDVTREQVLARLAEETEAVAALNAQFEEFAVGVDISAFVVEEERPFDWQEEIGALVRPILAELKSATAESRIIGDLRAAIDETEVREQTAAAAAANLEELTAAGPEEPLAARLAEDLERWRTRRDDAANRRVALELQLENRLAERTSVFDETANYAKNFFRKRGLNMVLGAGAFLAVFFGVRMLGNAYDRMYARRRGRTFSNRLGTLLFQVFSVVGGLGAMLVVFNMVGDWFLLGIIAIFLLGLGWASINTLPAHLETVKLMLNIGAVREGERIVYEGTPWQVENLGFSARLVNPLLDGGLQMLPVRYLVGLNSRPAGVAEEWFPCRQGDWVELADGRFGRVAYQTPSQVQLVELGGGQVVYQTPDFLAQSPRNLSTGFRVESVFGIDYRHQAECTGRIPEVMQARLEAELPAVLGENAVNHVRVDFMQAAASSLDFEIEVDLAGEAASHLPEIGRAVQHILVEACTEHGWEIPFQQVTVHTPAAAGSA